MKKGWLFFAFFCAGCIAQKKDAKRLVTFCPFSSLLYSVKAGFLFAGLEQTECKKAGLGSFFARFKRRMSDETDEKRLGRHYRVKPSAKRLPQANKPNVSGRMKIGEQSSLEQITFATSFCRNPAFDRPRNSPAILNFR